MSGPVHPNKPVTKYRVVNTYDKATATYYGSTVIISARDNYRTVREKIKNGRHILKLPNAPLKAKETMLAECLKARCRPQEFHENERRTWQNQIESAVQQNSRDPHGIVKSAPQLKGKILGIEIEYYPTSGVSIPPKNTLLHVGTDSSLANGGIELRKVTWQNNQGRLAGLCNLKLRGRVDSTCGLHVHVDARHFGTPEWVYDRITECYQPLKMLVPKNRWTSNYCKWVNNREESVCQWTETDASNRYAAVNWYAYNEHGSFEFRCQCGILQPVKIESWALVCQWLTNWVADERNELPTKWPIFLSIMPLWMMTLL